MSDLRTAAQQALEALAGYRRELNEQQPCDAEIALRAALAQADPVPIWKTLAEIGASAPAGTWDDPVKPTCEHCSSPLFAALECRVCGRKEAK